MGAEIVCRAVYKTSMWRTLVYFLNIGALCKAKDT
jgi:hypothetical protein